MNTGKMWFLVVSLFAFSLLGALVVPLGLPESIVLPRAVAQGPNTPTPTPTNTPTPTPTVMPCPDKVAETQHFAIEWCSNPGEPAYPPIGFTYIRVLSDSLEMAWDTISGPLGYEMPPLAAGKKITVEVVDPPIIICDLWNGGQVPAVSYPGKLWFWNNIGSPPNPNWQKEVLHYAAHEVFHQAQWHYAGFTWMGCPAWGWEGLIYYTPNRWWMESTAEWAVHEVDPSNYDYIKWMEPFYKAPERGVTAEDLWYSVVVFPKFIEEKKGGQDTIRTIWETARDEDLSCLEAVDYVLQQQGSSLQETSPEFATANYLKDYQDHWIVPQGAPAWHDVAVRDPQHRHLISLAKPEDAGYGEVNSLGASYVEFLRDGSASYPAGAVLRVHFEGIADRYTEIPVRLLKFIPSGGCNAPARLLPDGRCVEELQPDLECELSPMPPYICEFEEETKSFGTGYDKIAMVVNYIDMTPEPRLSTEYKYDIKLTHPDKTPPQLTVKYEQRSLGGGCPLVEVFVRAMDKETGLGQVKVGDIPIASLDTQPGDWAQVSMAMVGSGGSIDQKVTAIDKVGNSKELRIKYENKKTNCGGGGLHGPGGDHPDDNASAASAQAAGTVGTPYPTLPAGARSEPRVAVLGSGFDQATAQFIEQAGEPVTWVDTDFDPAMVEDYPVLVIPSGGLYGLSNSPLFRTRLEEYARRGGVIVAFAQQRGYEFAALPSPLPAGGTEGGLRAYGWTEDNSCYSASLYISNYHQTLSGFDRAYLNANVDGYFAAWPDEATVLLTRSKNGMPGAILYPYGGGWVIATTLYDDWGAGSGWSSADSRIFLRDLLSWAVAPATLPEYRPGDAVSLPVDVANGYNAKLSVMSWWQI